ncbi:MAG: helix-turn-helix domain-containing protein [Bacteroidales bacterium]|nr:helix-turn-helix domain-containing protein [Bacteroidales bacterium]
MGYKHLTREQRYTIEALLQTPMSLREIGEVIGVSTGTVSREIRRNCDSRGYHRYRWQLAQKKYERRMKTRRHYLKFTDERKRTVRRFIIYGQYIPKGTDFSELTDEMLAEIEWKLNHRPRKSLGYRTPLEYCKQLFIFDF